MKKSLLLLASALMLAVFAPKSLGVTLTPEDLLKAAAQKWGNTLEGGNCNGGISDLKCEGAYLNGDHETCTGKCNAFDPAAGTVHQPFTCEGVYVQEANGTWKVDGEAECKLN